MVNAYGGDGRGQNILGRPINSFFGYVADGLFRSEEEIANHADQPGKGLGRISYVDLNDDGVINDYDRTWIGVPHPDFTYGLNANITFHQFDFSFLLQGVAGVDVVNDFKYQQIFGVSPKQDLIRVQDYWMRGLQQIQILIYLP